MLRIITIYSRDLYSSIQYYKNSTYVIGISLGSEIAISLISRCNLAYISLQSPVELSAIKLYPGAISLSSNRYASLSNCTHLSSNRPHTAPKPLQTVSRSHRLFTPHEPRPHEPHADRTQTARTARRPHTDCTQTARTAHRPHTDRTNRHPSAIKLYPGAVCPSATNLYPGAVCQTLPMLKPLLRKSSRYAAHRLLRISPAAHRPCSQGQLRAHNWQRHGSKHVPWRLPAHSVGGERRRVTPYPDLLRDSGATATSGAAGEFVPNRLWLATGPWKRRRGATRCVCECDLGAGGVRGSG